MNQKKIYQVVWEDEALKQLRQLLSETEAEKIQELTEKILSQDPYNELKYIKRKVRPNKHINIKRLEWDWEGSWRLKYKKYRIIYEILESQIIVNVFKFDNRLNAYNQSSTEDDKDF